MLSTTSPIWRIWPVDCSIRPMAATTSDRLSCDQRDMQPQQGADDPGGLGPQKIKRQVLQCLFQVRNFAPGCSPAPVLRPAGSAARPAAAPCGQAPRSRTPPGLQTPTRTPRKSTCTTAQAKAFDASAGCRGPRQRQNGHPYGPGWRKHGQNQTTGQTDHRHQSLKQDICQMEAARRPGPAPRLAVNAYQTTRAG